VRPPLWARRASRAGRRRVGVLGERPFRLVFGAYVVSLVGDGIVPVALAFAVLDLTGSPTDLGLVLAARTVPLVACLLAGGVVADRTSRRRVMIAADLVRLVSQGVLGLLLVSGHARLWEVAALQAVLGAATGFFNPASTGLVPMVAGADRLQEANALRGVAMAGGQVVGPAIGGVLVATVGAGEALLADAATYAASALLLARVHVTERPTGERATFLADLRDGWREVISRMGCGRSSPASPWPTASTPRSSCWDPWWRSGRSAVPAPGRPSSPAAAPARSRAGSPRCACGRAVRSWLPCWPVPWPPARRSYSPRPRRSWRSRPRRSSRAPASSSSRRCGRRRCSATSP
jgi:MFS family permease